MVPSPSILHEGRRAIGFWMVEPFQTSGDALVMRKASLDLLQSGRHLIGKSLFTSSDNEIRVNSGYVETLAGLQMAGFNITLDPNDIGANM